MFIAAGNNAAAAAAAESALSEDPRTEHLWPPGRPSLSGPRSAREWTGVEALLAPDVVLDWPTSRERIVGAANVVAVIAKYPNSGRSVSCASSATEPTWPRKLR